MGLHIDCNQYNHNGNGCRLSVLAHVVSAIQAGEVSIFLWAWGVTWWLKYVALGRLQGGV